MISVPIILTCGYKNTRTHRRYHLLYSFSIHYEFYLHIPVGTIFFFFDIFIYYC